MNLLKPKLDERLVKRTFEQVAPCYDDFSFLQKEVNERMAARLNYINFTPANILDAGSGTGYGASLLRQCYGDTPIIETDIALPMLWQSHQKFSNEYPPTKKQWLLNADIGMLPIASNQMDMVWSNLALHWINRLDDTLKEFYRVLRLNGCVMFSLFGEQTLQELRYAFWQANQKQSVHGFMPIEEVGDALVNAGFSEPVVDKEVITLTYPDILSMVRDFRGNGACNQLLGRRTTLMGKKRWQNMAKHYESFRKNGDLPATCEIIYGHAWRMESSSSDF